ncbi:HAMP domain-containing sensor histidine kinase [Stenotrophomonas sp.]|uniref:sensor histidine kinase n=1 Tax=Stenotrophomonas sp. TaxID=69392 RepID=UPI002899FFFC|nr:HAMP domain-containing sensor histidine kinase [Stenotrophomonas sp.]
MSASTAPRRRLRHRLMLSFAGFALLVATLYGFYAVVFVYLVEDQMFSGLLQQEAQAQGTHHARTGQWRTPALPFIQVHPDPGTLPDDLGQRLAAEPWRREFAGEDGRHYHLLRLDAPERAWLVAEVSQQLVVRPMRGGIAQWLGWSGLAVVLLALLIGAWLARRMTAPLTELAALVDSATPARLPHGFAERLTDDEVGVLARTLERLMARIEDFVTREREFTRDASHELRTPLAVIRSACERMSLRVDLAPDVREQVAYIHQSAQQLERTVSTLLTLAREEHEREKPSEVALLPLLERAIVDHAMLLEGRAIDVDLQVAATAKAYTPPTALQIVVSNLVGNAFAHATAGTISITAVDDGLRIANSGSGLDASTMEPFVRGTDSAGHGLGLTIVRRVCERHGFEFQCASLDGRVEVAVQINRVEGRPTAGATGLPVPTRGRHRGVTT